MSDHRTAASPAASPPGASATLIASCRAEPFAYASMSLDRRPAAAAERRRAERAINATRPATTRTPSRIQSQSRLVPEEALASRKRWTAGGAAAAAWLPVWVDGGAVGAAVTLGLTGTVALGSGGDGRGPARQAAGRAGDGAPASRCQASGDKKSHRKGQSFRRTSHADPSASLTANHWSVHHWRQSTVARPGYRFPHPCRGRPCRRAPNHAITASRIPSTAASRSATRAAGARWCRSS